MLHEFIAANRAEIIARCREKIASRPAPRPTDVEVEHGVPLFLDQLADTLRYALDPNPAMGRTAAQHGSELLRGGFTIAQVVHDYGGVCQAITELAVETAAPITASDFQVLNLCLDNAIADAVSEYSRLREHEGTERLGILAHELRNLLNSAVLSFDMLKTGSVGMGGSTGAVLGRSLAGLRRLIDRELADVRLSAGILHRETVLVRDFIGRRGRGDDGSECSPSSALRQHGCKQRDGACRPTGPRVGGVEPAAERLQVHPAERPCLAAHPRDDNPRAHRRRGSMRRAAAGKSRGAISAVRTEGPRSVRVGPWPCDRLPWRSSQRRRDPRRQPSGHRVRLHR